MSIINAEVTAENRPASSGRQPCWFYEGGKTHKKESSIQISAVLLLKVAVVFSDFLFELVVETGPRVRAAILLQYRLQGVT